MSAAADVVGHFGCMQSQDFAMAKWAIARRCDGVTNRMLDAAFDDGHFLRTHILRPTWHFVCPEDLHWIQALTATRVHRLMAGTNARIGLDEGRLAAAGDVIVAALGAHGQLTRSQLADHLDEARLHARGLELAHIMMRAELECLITNGPRQGTQHTYRLAPKPSQPAPGGEQLLARIAQTYVRGHGPSRPADLSWWTSLTLTQSREAFELAGLKPMTIDDSTYWGIPTEADDPPLAALMPPFDEAISYVEKPIDRSSMVDNMPDLARSGGLLFIHGLISGTWTRQIRSSRVDIQVLPRGALTPKIIDAIEFDAARFAAFIELPLTLQITA